MSNRNETAEAIWIVIKRLFKWGLLVGASIVLIAVLFALYLDYQNEKSSEERWAKENKVVIKAWYDKTSCTPKYPYAYLIQNTGDLTVEKVEFTVEIKRKGYSNRLNIYTKIEDDKILKPGDQTLMCFTVEKKDYSGALTIEDVDIEVGYKSVSFAQEAEK